MTDLKKLIQLYCENEELGVFDNLLVDNNNCFQLGMANLTLDIAANLNNQEYNEKLNTLIFHVLNLIEIYENKKSIINELTHFGNTNNGEHLHLVPNLIFDGKHLQQYKSKYIAKLMNEILTPDQVLACKKECFSYYIWLAKSKFERENFSGADMFSCMVYSSLENVIDSVWGNEISKEFLIFVCDFLNTKSLTCEGCNVINISDPVLTKKIDEDGDVLVNVFLNAQYANHQNVCVKLDELKFQ